MTVQLVTEDVFQTWCHDALTLGCADCGGDLARGYAISDETTGELVCLSCNWFLQTEREDWTVDPEDEPLEHLD